jgi:hypothetical protein
VLLAYAYVAMFVAVFLAASGTALLVKAALTAPAGRDFSYNTEPEWYYWSRSEDSGGAHDEPLDPSDDAIRNDIAGGVTLALIGGFVFGIHGIGAELLRRREAQGQRLLSRSYNLLGLAAGTIAVLAGLGTAVHDFLRRYAFDTSTIEPWDFPRPGGALGGGVVFLPLMLWFGWRIWQEFALETTAQARENEQP